MLGSLVKGGAFDSLGHSRLALARVHEEAVDAVVPFKRREADGQFDLFHTDHPAPDPEGSDRGGDETEAADSVLAHLDYTSDEWPRKQLLAYEREMLGLYVSAHPLDGAEQVLRRYAPKPIAVLVDDAPADGEVIVAGMIASVERRINKKGEPWAIVVIEDLDASIDVLFFARAYNLWKSDLLADATVAVKGRVNWRDDKMAIFANELIVLDTPDTGQDQMMSSGVGAARGPVVVPLRLRAELEQVTEDAVLALKNVLCSHRGDTPVHLVMTLGTRELWLDVAGYPVTTSPELVRAVQNIPGMRVLP